MALIEFKIQNPYSIREDFNRAIDHLTNHPHDQTYLTWGNRRWKVEKKDALLPHIKCAVIGRLIDEGWQF